MENLYQLDQFPREIHHDYNLEPASHLDYQQTQNSQQLESNTNDRGRMPHIPTSSTSLSIMMDWTNPYPSPDFDIDLLVNEWSEPQMVFGHNWGETQIAYGELNSVMVQAEFYSPSQPYWPLESLQSDTMFDNFSFQGAVGGSCYPTQTSSASWNYPTPVPSTPSANSDQYNYYPELNGILEKPRATAQPSPKAGYTCEACGVKYHKLHLLNDHKKIHEKSVTCPVQRCPHRTAKSRDMDRHVRARHPDYVKAQALPTPPRPVCPVSSCKQGRRGFARKDHLQRHLKKAHPDWLPQR